MSLLDEMLEEDYKSGYEFINKEENESYKILGLYRKKDNMTKFIFYDKRELILNYVEMDYDLFRKEATKDLNIKHHSLYAM
jgi:hypothetical protein